MGKPRHFLLAAVAAIGSGAAAGAVLALFGGGFFGLLLPLIAGVVVGEVTVRAGSGLRASPFKVIAGAGAFAGMFLGPVLLGASLIGVLNPRALVMAGLAAAAAVWSVSR